MKKSINAVLYNSFIQQMCLENIPNIWMLETHWEQDTQASTFTDVPADREIEAYRVACFP